MEMILTSQEDVKQFFEKLPASVKNNPSFGLIAYDVEQMVSDMQYKHNGPMKVFISDDGKFARVRDRGYQTEDHRGRKMETEVVEYSVDDDGKVEVVKASGTQYDARTYKPAEGEQIPYGTTVIMDKHYRRTVYDKEGIELATSSFGMTGWPLSYETYGNIEQFHTQLLSKGHHMPEKWTDNGPELPQFCQNAYIGGITRSPDNPAFATVYTRQTDGTFGRFPGYKHNDVYLGEVHSEWPHGLRVDHYEMFAKYEGGKLKLLEGTYDRDFPGQSLQEIVKSVALRYERALEGSKTKESCPSQYETLKARLEKANAQYKPKQEEKAPEESSIGEAGTGMKF